MCPAQGHFIVLTLLIIHDLSDPDTVVLYIARKKHLPIEHLRQAVLVG